jgi:tRNA(Ile2) C34 agmatinyltransferase TiaS
VVIGIDDTDSPKGGATFALALALLQHIAGMDGLIPIGHHVAMLYPALPGKTAGNSCSFIDVAAEPGVIDLVKNRVCKFVSDEALSQEWGIAIRTGFRIPPELRGYGRLVRSGVVSREFADRVARNNDVILYGGRGVVGALAAVSLWGLDNAVLLNVDAGIPGTGT